MRTRRSIVLAAFLAATAFAPSDFVLAGDRLMVEHSKEPTKAKSGLGYQYTFKVMKHGSHEPVDGADFMISTDMPAMPGAHHMPHVKGEATGASGTYKAEFDFDMPGDWNLILKFSKPQRDQVVISDNIEKKEGGHSDHSSHSTDHSKHSTDHSSHGSSN